MVAQKNFRVDSFVSGLAFKAPCIVVSDINLTLSGEQTVNTVPVVVGDRVLVAAQTDPIENGIYNVETSTWQRAGDFDGNRDATRGTLVSVTAASGADNIYQLDTAGQAEIGTDAIDWSLSAAASGGGTPQTADEITAGVTPTSIQYEPGNVLRYGAVGDGIVDDRDALSDAVLAMGVSGGTVYFPVGTYLVSRYVYVFEADYITFKGEKGAQIVYPSDDLSVLDDAITFSTNQARSAFFILNSDHVTFMDMRFKGGTDATIADNIGCAAYFRECSHPSMWRCRNDDGAALFQSDQLPEDVGMVIDGCQVYAQRGNNRTGAEAVVTNSHFELPDTTDYDRVGGEGSTHALYFWAGKNNIKVHNNTFKNFRTNGVKVSGTSLVVDSFSITDNTFIECGRAIEVGADTAVDAQHTSFNITGNIMFDCGTQRENWFQGIIIASLGAKNVNISDNQFYFTREAIFNVAGLSGIHVSNYQGTGPELENVIIDGNQFSQVDGLTPGQILTATISANRIGYNGAEHGGACHITNNQIMGVGAGIHMQRCLGGRVVGNTFWKIATPIQLGGNRFPVVHDNVAMTGTGSSANAQIRLNSDSFPIIYNNFSSGMFELGQGRSMSMSDGINSAAVTDFPLRGVAGRAVPNEGFAEVVAAFGDDWVDGDTVLINGTTQTYRDAAPGANEFTTAAQLIVLIQAQAGLNCVDYGDPWSITTQHLKISRDTAAAGAFTIDRTVTNKTAFVTLKNGTGGDPARSIARGSEAAPGQLTLVWSPMIQNHSVVTLVAEESTAATLLAANSYFEDTKTTDDAGCVLKLNHGNVAGTEEFRWAIH